MSNKCAKGLYKFAMHKKRTRKDKTGKVLAIKIIKCFNRDKMALYCEAVQDRAREDEF